jgi:hypothetical protein
MALKLTSRQQAQLAFLEPFARQMSTIGTLIEQMAAPKADEQLARTLVRQLGAAKTNAQGLGLTRIADSLGGMEQTARRTGGGLSKFRTLRELHAMLRLNHEQALRAAMTEEAHGGEDEPAH